MLGVFVLCVLAVVIGPSPRVGALVDPDEPPSDLTDDTDARLPLIEAPTGCVQPELPDVVFVGTTVDRDFRTARFEVVQVRAGDMEPFAVGGFVDVRYGLDVQYLERGVDYLVSARRDPVIGVLYSRVRAPVPEFGGDDIVGLAESDVECPGFEDPVKTLHPDGRGIETSVLEPLFGSRGRLLAALVVPFGVAFGLVFVLAMLRLGVAGVIRGVRDAAAVRARRRA